MSKVPMQGLTLLTLLTVATPSASQVIQGVAISSFDGRVIPVARVHLVDPAGHVVAATEVDSEGRFSIRSPGLGSYHLHADAAGFLSVYDGPINLTDSARVTVELVLRPDPVSLDPLDVSVQRRSDRLVDAGFYDRRASGSGVHLDRDQIAQRPAARSVSDLLRGIPGVRVDNRGYVRLRGMSSLRGRCEYRVYLDGVLVVSRAAWDEEWPRSLIHPANVEGIEIFRRPSELPAQFSGGEGGCGVILIWSRH